MISTKLLSNKKKKNLGFTLIELIVAIVISGVVAASMATMFVMSLNQAKQLKTEVDLDNEMREFMRYCKKLFNEAEIINLTAFDYNDTQYQVVATQNSNRRLTNQRLAGGTNIIVIDAKRRKYNVTQTTKSAVNISSEDDLIKYVKNYIKGDYQINTISSNIQRIKITPHYVNIQKIEQSDDPNYQIEVEYIFSKNDIEKKEIDYITLKNHQPGQ